MTELDLTEAIEAAREEAADWLVSFADAKVIDGVAEAAVRAAAPIIERATRERAIGYRFVDPRGSGWIVAAPEDVEIIYPAGEAK